MTEMQTPRQDPPGLANELRRLEHYLNERYGTHKFGHGYVDLAAVVKTTAESMGQLAARAERLAGLTGDAEREIAERLR